MVFEAFAFLSKAEVYRGLFKLQTIYSTKGLFFIHGRQSLTLCIIYKEEIQLAVNDIEGLSRPLICKIRRTLRSASAAIC